MTKQKKLQNGEKTIVEPKKKSDRATTKEKDYEKEGDTVSQQEEHRKGRRKRAHISEVEKLQIAGALQVNPTKLRAAVGEQKRPRTKITQHRPPKENVGSGKVAEVVDGCRKQEAGASKNVTILSELCPYLLFSGINHVFLVCRICKFLMHV